MANSDTQATLVTGTQYTTITLSNFTDFMDSVATYRQHIPAGSKEHTFDIPLPHDDLVLRVLSSIVCGESRDKDKDALRAYIYDTADDHTLTDEDRIISEVFRSYRIAPTESNPEGWRGNLRPDIKFLAEHWREYDRHCQQCGSRLTVVTPGPHDDWSAFFGCRRHPHCKYSEGLPELE